MSIFTGIVVFIAGSILGFFVACLAAASGRASQMEEFQSYCSHCSKSKIEEE